MKVLLNHLRLKFLLFYICKTKGLLMPMRLKVLLASAFETKGFASEYAFET